MLGGTSDGVELALSLPRDSVRGELLTERKSFIGEAGVIGCVPDFGVLSLSLDRALLFSGECAL